MPEATDVAGDYQDRFITVDDGTTLYARDYPAIGDDTKGRLPVICLHGLTRNSKDFEALAPWIAKMGRRVIVPDTRGRGRSGKSADAMRYVPPVYAQDVHAILKHLGIGKAIFIGTSMGGIVTTLVAARHSKMVAAALLNDIGPVLSNEGLDRIKAYAGRPVTLEKWDDAIAYMDGLAELTLPNLTPEQVEVMARRTFRVDEHGKPSFDYDMRIGEPFRKNRRATPPWLAWLFFRWLARRPLMLVRGGISDLLTAETAAKMRGIAPDLKYLELEGVGHAPLLDEPEAREGIAEWLVGLD